MFHYKLFVIMVTCLGKFHKKTSKWDFEDLYIYHNEYSQIFYTSHACTGFSHQSVRTAKKNGSFPPPKLKKKKNIGFCGTG